MEVQKEIDKITAQFIQGAITDLILAKQERNWEYVTIAINRLYAIRDNLRDE